MKSNPGTIIGIAIIIMGLIGLISQIIKINDGFEISYAKIILSLVITGYGVIKIRSTRNKNSE